MIFGVILGLVLAGCFAFMVTMIMVNKSNVLGDSKGTFKDFSKMPLHMINKKDDISKREFY